MAMWKGLVLSATVLMVAMVISPAEGQGGFLQRLTRRLGRQIEGLEDAIEDVGCEPTDFELPEGNAIGRLVALFNRLQALQTELATCLAQQAAGAQQAEGTEAPEATSAEEATSAAEATSAEEPTSAAEATSAPEVTSAEEPTSAEEVTSMEV